MSGFLRNRWDFLGRLWKKLVGDPSEFPLENRSFHATSIITLLVLFLLLPFNIYFSLYTISVLLAMVVVAQAFIYYLSRVKRKYYVGTTIYIFVSYAVVSATYYFNSGSHGPALILFFLSFMLLISATPRRQHGFFMVAHVLLGCLLLGIEYTDIGFITYTYVREGDRYLDIASSYVVALGFIYFIIIYLRNNYAREKQVAVDGLEEIAQQNRQLEMLNGEKNKLFSIISHDLRSPLNSIQSYLELLSVQSLEPTERAQMENALLDMTRNTSDMLYNLLTWSKAQMEGVTVNLRHIHLFETLSNLLELEQAIADKKQIILSYDISKSIMLMADADMLQLVMRNLLNNAIKFTHPGGTIAVKAEVENNVCIISIADTGVGMTTEQLQQLFALSYTSSFGTQNEKGVGLGLVLCKDFIERQKGRIHVDSLPGAGSSFFVYLPCE